MKRNTGKTAALFIVSIMALASTGAAYALWSDELYINGTVETGTLCGAFTDASISDPYSASGEHIDKNCNDSFVNIRDSNPPKDVGWMTEDISADGKTLTVTFNNVYPGYYGNGNYHLENCGTIPWHFDHLNLYVNGIYITTITGSGTYWYAEDYHFEIYFEVLGGAQVHPDNILPYLDLSFGVHIFQGAEQGATYTFTLEPVVIQYNEDWIGPYV